MSTATATRFTVESVRALHAEAHAAGIAAGEAVGVPVSIVGTAIGLSSEIDPSERIYIDTAGPCGFTSIRFKGNTSFARAMKKAGLAKSSDYFGGMYVWVTAFGQSAYRKDAYGYAYAAVLAEHGIASRVDSRLD